jgi:DNA polymerase-3 subunit alpha
MAEPRFVHLRVHSDYSMIDGLAKTGPLVKKAASLGMPALAITDFTNLCGLVKFYGTAHGAGLNLLSAPIFMFRANCSRRTDAAHRTGSKQRRLSKPDAADFVPISAATGRLGPWIDRDWLVELKKGADPAVAPDGDVAKA